MFLIRRAKVEDVSTLLKLAKMVHFINLPADKDIITDKVMRSRESFLKAAALTGVAPPLATDKPAPSPRKNKPAKPVATPNGRHAVPAGDGLASLIKSSDLFMFVIEELSSAGVLGTSQILTRMGGPGAPNVSLKLSRKEMFSSSLQVGATHIVAKLVLDESGPTEIGGLILQPSYRGHPLRLGRLLSLVRFHVMGLYRPLFSDKVLAEMMGPMTPDGQNTLWEYLGRRFINLTYIEADRFCQYSKEFMTSLLPHEEIYLTLLPPEARAVIAQVGPETAAARRMLEKLGFRYLDHIDPFDGGPHLEAATDDIVLVKNTRVAPLASPSSAAPKEPIHGIVSVLDGDGEFRAVETDFELDRSGAVKLSTPIMKTLAVEPGVSVGYTPLDTPASAAPKPSASKPRRRAARASK